MAGTVDSYTIRYKSWILADAYECYDSYDKLLYKIRPNLLWTRLDLADISGGAAGTVRRKFWSYEFSFHDASGQLIGTVTRDAIKDAHGMTIAKAKKMRSDRVTKPGYVMMDCEITDPKDGSLIAMVSDWDPKLSVFRGDFPRLVLIEFAMASFIHMGFDAFLKRVRRFGGFM
jgi:hypothetical protein